MIDLIETIVKSLVDYPDHVNVKEEVAGSKVTYFLTVHQDDMGKIIGKQGRVAKSIRTVVYAAATNEKEHIYLEII